MKTINKILFVGGDARTARIAAILHNVYPTTEIVLSGLECEIIKGCRMGEWKAEAEKADVIILPLPLTADGVFMEIRENGVKTKLDLRTFIEDLGAGKLILGGQVPYFYKRLIEECGCVSGDYFDSEVVQLRNAVPTAEGAIGIAVSELPVTIANCPIVVMGYGRCGYALASRLHLLGADVTVAVRRREAQVMAEGDGCHGISIRELQTNPPPCRMLFNTIPAPLLSTDVIKKFHPDCIFVELASGTGGGIQKEAEKVGRRFIKASGLPGKTAPETAGGILAEMILEWINDYRGEGVCQKN